ncbi:MAG TPA: SUMF1/EgtB/PvdO family nonheme iron enzyme [Pyrinomonadaceae bacterium]
MRETVALDPNRTIASTVTTLDAPLPPPPQLPGNTTQPPVGHETQFATSLDLSKGSVSYSQLEPDPETTHVQRNAAPTVVDSIAPQPPPSAPRPITPPPQQAQFERGKPMTIDLRQRRGLSPLWFVGAGVFVLVLIGLGIGGYLLWRSQSDPGGGGAKPSPTVTAHTKADLVPITGGSFLMGRDNGPPLETPAHQVAVQQFQMDRTEVNNTEYADFVSETKYPPPSHWAGSKPPFGQELWPVVNVSFDDANAFASWRSKRDGVTYRLPTEQEWEYAARNGERNDLYPWGPDWKEGAAVLKQATPAAVGSHPEGRNRWGVVDLMGNVWEWTASKPFAYPGNKFELKSEYENWRTIRGGCYVSDPRNAEAPVTACLRAFLDPSTRNTLLGFRLVRSGP